MDGNTNWQTASGNGGTLNPFYNIDGGAFGITRTFQFSVPAQAYVRVVVLPQHSGRASYSVTLRSVIDTPTSDADSNWADIDGSAFVPPALPPNALAPFVQDESSTSWRQKEFRFVRVLNNSYSDLIPNLSTRPDDARWSIRLYMDKTAGVVNSDPGKYGTLDALTTFLANGLAHEVGHTLGAIHQRVWAASNTYVNVDPLNPALSPDIMGKAGSTLPDAYFT